MRYEIKFQKLVNSAKLTKRLRLIIFVTFSTHMTSYSELSARTQEGSFERRISLGTESVDLVENVDMKYCILLIYKVLPINKSTNLISLMTDGEEWGISGIFWEIKFFNPSDLIFIYLDCD